MQPGPCGASASPRPIAAHRGSVAPLPFDADAARAYGRIYAAVTAAGRKAREARAVDLMIAAVACSAELPLYTRNPSDFAALDGLVDIVGI